MNTIKFGKGVVRYRIAILVVAIALLVPAIYGAVNTRINYDMLTYLPEDMDTVVGQNILLEDFGKGAFSFILVEDMDTKDIVKLKEDIEKVDHVNTVLWYDSLLDTKIPMEILPSEVYQAFNEGSTTMLAVFFDTSTSADDTMAAVKEIRSVTNKQCFVTGMSALVADLKDLCEKEEPIYVGLAVVCALAAMMLFMDNYLAPIVFLLSIGLAIVYNLGTNIFMGEISYLTKALSAVLQLAVTMDYSIFLWNSYSEQRIRFEGDKKRAMAHAIKATISSVLGSSITTIAGFLALMFMSFTLGKDLGIVMAKGVLLGVISCITILPAMILMLDPILEKTKHKPLLPTMKKLPAWIVNHSWVGLVLLAALVVPALIGYQKTNEEVYYDMGASLPKDMDYVIANSKLQDTFSIGSTHMLLVDAGLPDKEVREMLDEIGKLDGVSYALGLESVVGSLVPEDMLPESLVNILQSDQWKLLLVNSEYKVASDEVSQQLDAMNEIVKKYDKTGMIIGEAPCTKDMIEVTDHDFQVVTVISIVAIFLIIAVVLESASLPVILVTVIEFAIFINLGLPHYTGVSLPFVAPICISTIQLGATVDYAILMTTRYKRERRLGMEKKAAVTTALETSMPSIIVSALGFFAATFGVALYSDIDIISSMCNLMARGAIVSMFAVILVLPALLLLCDWLVCHTTRHIRKENLEAQSEKG